MLSPKSTISYLAQACAFGGGDNASFATFSDHWSVSFKDVHLGRIPEGTTKNVIGAAARANGRSASIQSVSVVISLRTLCALDGSTNAPLIMLAGNLDARGKLSVNPQAGAWIPLSRVSTDEYHNNNVVVCGIDNYRAHQMGMDTLPNDGSWTVAVDRAIDLFDSINELHDEDLRPLGLRIDTNRCLLRLWAPFDDVRMASQVLTECLGNTPSKEDDDAHADQEDDPQPSYEAHGSLSKLLGSCSVEQAKTEDDANATQDLSEDAFISHKLVCGIPDHLPPLTPDDLSAIASVAMQQTGDVTVLRTPAGTHVHRVSLALLANTLTTSALRGDDMPALACIAPQEDLAEISRIISSRPSGGLVALTSRWLPRIDGVRARHASPGTDGRRILGPLGALMMYHAHDASMGHGNSMKGCLTKSFERADAGSALPYADPWYIPRASTYYLDCVSSFVGDRVHSLLQASATLLELLRHIDQDRCDLIDLFAEVCKAWELHKQREVIIECIKDVRKEHASCKDRLRFWEELLRNNPTRRHILGRVPHSQQALIAQNALPGEELALGHVLVADVCSAYRAEIERVEGNLDRLRGASANLTRRIQPASKASERCSVLANQLIINCGLNEAQCEALKRLVEGREEDVSLVALDSILDQAIRPAEFWLAVHAYEARWLDLCLHQNPGQEESLSYWGNLCPFGLIPQDSSVGVLHAYGHADMTIVVGSNQMEIPRGMALASLSDRMTLMGSAASLGPWPLRGKTFDELHAVAALGNDTWYELLRTRLAVSSDVSLYDYAQYLMGSNCISLLDVDSSNSEMALYRNDLMPHEQIRLQMPDVDVEAMGEILPPLSYVLVPDSAWTQVGTNRHNAAEAFAIRRWLANHIDDIRNEYPNSRHPLVIVAPYEAQARLLQQTLGSGVQDKDVVWDVRALKDLKGGTWPIVVLSATCGPNALRNEGTMSARTVLSIAASVTEDALVLFCGGAWLRSAEEVATSTMRRALRVGRLFSSPRRHTKKNVAEPHTEARTEQELRALPIPLPAFIAMLRERGDIGRMPPASLVVQALVKVGLIEKVEGPDGEEGFRPTAAGREIGIIAITDRAGNTSCAYANESTPVIASLIDAMDAESSVF